MDTTRMQDLEEQALEARSRRQFEKLEEKIQKRQLLEGRLLEAEREFREEKSVRKELEEVRNEMNRRLTESTSTRLGAEKTAKDYKHLEREIADVKNSIAHLEGSVMPELHKELARIRAKAKQDKDALANLDGGSHERHVLEMERIEAKRQMEEQLHALGVQVARLGEAVTASDKISERDSETMKGLLNDGSKMLNAAHADVLTRKGELKNIDERLVRIMKNLDRTTEAHKEMRNNLVNGHQTLNDFKEKDELEDRYMHRRLAQPYMREELKGTSLPKMMATLNIALPKKIEPMNINALTVDEMIERQMAEEQQDKLQEALDNALADVKVPSDPLNELNGNTVAGTLQDTLKPDVSEGEILVGKSLELLQKMKETSSESTSRVNNQVDYYQRTLAQLDKEIALASKHLKDGDLTKWDEQIPQEVAIDAQLTRLGGGKAKKHVKGKTLLELFHYYDQDGNGFVNKGELICILSDVGVLGGLTPDDASNAVDMAWAAADDNGDGGITYKEFAKFMSGFKNVKPRKTLQTNIQEKFLNEDDSLFQVYLQHCSKKYPQEMGSAQFVRACRKANFIDAMCTASACCIVFAKSREELQKRIKFPGFLRALAQIASMKSMNFEAVANQFERDALLYPIAVHKDRKLFEGMNDEAPTDDDAPLTTTRFRPEDDDAIPTLTPAAGPMASTKPKPIPTVKATPSSVADSTSEALKDLQKRSKPVDMKSWDTKQAIDDVGQAPVQKSMVEASGKRMSVRDLYNTYDNDGDGGLDMDEMSALITEMELVKGLSAEDAQVVLGEYFKNADADGDGKISFDEFALFYIDLQKIKKSGTSNLAVKIPKGLKQNAEFKALYVDHCSYGKGLKKIDEMDGAALARMFKNANMLDKKFTSTAVDIIFTKSKEKTKRKITYAQFLSSLGLVCAHKGIEYTDLVNVLTETGPPTASGAAGPGVSKPEPAKRAKPAKSGPLHPKPSAPVAALIAKVGEEGDAASDLPEPKPVLNKAGKRMSIREMYNAYGPDGLKEPAFAKLFQDLGLPADKASATFVKSDVNGDGQLDFNEFTAFYNSLKGGKQRPGSVLAAPVPVEFKKNKEFKELFIAHCSYGKGQNKIEELDGAAFSRIFKNAGLFDAKLSATSVDIIFTKVKAKSARKIKYDEYLSGLAQAAATLGITFEELAEKLTAKGPP